MNRSNDMGMSSVGLKAFDRHEFIDNPTDEVIPEG
jgi:hypothetical protein